MAKADKYTKTVLIVDDDISILRAMDFLFIDEPYKIINAETMADARKMLLSLIPDLIILDIELPEKPEDAGYKEPLGGIKLLEKIKQDHHTKHIPVVMLSVKGESAVVQQAHKAGAEYFITKPFNTDDILDKVRIILH